MRGGNHLVQLVSSYMRGSLPACVKGGYDFVDVRDVANGCILAAEKGKSGGCYIFSGHYASVKELLAMAGKFCGKSVPPMIPMFLAKMAVPFLAGFSKLRKARPLYTAYSLHTLSCNGHFSRQKAEKELGYTVRDMEETVRDMVLWLKKHNI